MKRVVIAGGTGYIGKALIPLLQKDYELVILTRHPQRFKNQKKLSYKAWDCSSLITSEVDGAYAIINLVGENIGGKRWTEKQKKLILESRILPSEYISQSISKAIIKPKVWIQGSATGFYGPWDFETSLDEYSPHADKNFLAQVCEEWEKPIQNLKCDSLRKVIVRTGVTIAKDSLMMLQFLKSFNFYVGAIVGNGKDYLPWVHTEDEVRAIKYLLEHNSCAGIFNLSAPNSVSTRELIYEIGHYKRALFTIHVPRFALNLLFGRQMTKELILSNQNVYPTRLLEAGFKFKYNNIQQAMEQILKK